jgi:MoaA/NifB/PqqE/SkfB family radical SAM enzyme
VEDTKEKDLEENADKSTGTFSTGMYTFLLKKTFQIGVARNLLFKTIEKRMYKTFVEENKDSPKNVQIKKFEFFRAMLDSFKRNFEKKYISTDVANRIIDTLVKFNFVDNESQQKIKANFKEKHGQLPPSFIVFSPTQKCNLQCKGCYASSTINSPTLSYEVVDKVVNEVYNEWGDRFMTISGGEPLMYKDKGKTLFDIWEKYKDMFFLFYTNGTFIDKEIAQKIAKLGNVTPSISIEGWEKETDDRRGKGMFNKIMEAAKNLREAGVPFGVSVTATSKNIDVLLDDKFYDFLFQEMGATYMLTPEQRVKLFRKWETLIREKKYPIADFWNSGVLVSGCIAYGRSEGYLYIDWNGNIMPCAFVPFYEDNILDLYKKGKKLTDSLFSDLFKNGRKWQNEYGLNDRKKPDNWLMPCSIRDHFKNFKTNILSKTAKPEDCHAKAAIESKEYEKVLEEFDKDLEKRTLPIWKNEYLDK